MKNKIIKTISTFFYLGYLPARGTIASIFPLLVFFFLKDNLLVYGVFAVLSVITAFLVSGKAEALFRKKDPKEVVIDEIAGMSLGFLFLDFKWGYAIAGFIIFRFFDIAKIYPIRRLENLKGSLGIVLDDVFAAIYTNLIVHIIKIIAGNLR